MNYNKTQVYGKLYAGTQEYWIVSPHPEDLDVVWYAADGAFFGVNLDRGFYGEDELEGEQYPKIYPVPYAIIVSGTWHIELTPPALRDFIWCEKPAILAENGETEQDAEEDESLYLFGDLVHLEDYRSLDLEYEEESFDDDENEEAEIEEEALVEEG